MEGNCGSRTCPRTAPFDAYPAASVNFAPGAELLVGNNDKALNEELTRNEPVVSLMEESLDGPKGTIRGAGKPQQLEKPSSPGGI